MSTEKDASPSREVFVWDTTGPLHAARCGHIDWLLDAAGRGRRRVLRWPFDIGGNTRWFAQNEAELRG